MKFTKSQISEFESSMSQIQKFSEELHRKNQLRIKVGLWCIAIIPMIFLILLFVMNRSNVVFLTLWVISLFIIAGYLVTVAYLDYEMQEKLKELGIQMRNEHNHLIGD